jgi:hypothetical protein
MHTLHSIANWIHYLVHKHERIIILSKLSSIPNRGLPANKSSPKPLNIMERQKKHLVAYLQYKVTLFTSSCVKAMNSDRRGSKETRLEKRARQREWSECGI